MIDANKTDKISKTKKDAALTPKQERFCQLIAGGTRQTHAYKEVYDVSKSADNSIYVSASELMANPKVKVRIDSLRATMMDKVAEEVSYDYSEAMNELDVAIAIATSNGHSGAIVAALNLKQKISGLHVEDRKNDRNPVGTMSHERIKAVLTAIEAIKKARGIA